MCASSRDQEYDVSITVDVAFPSSLRKEVLPVICWHFICASKNRLQDILADLFQPGIRTVKWGVSPHPVHVQAWPRLECITSNAGRMVGEFGKDLEGDGLALVPLLFGDFHAGTEENFRNLSEDSW
jgi:hypothetical protein